MLVIGIEKRRNVDDSAFDGAINIQLGIMSVLQSNGRVFFQRRNLMVCR